MQNVLKILIINPPIRLHDKPRNIPHGLAILANVIRRDIGVEPFFLDINGCRYTDKEVEEIINRLDFNVVLIGGLAPVYRSILSLSKLIKEKRPEAIVIVGGYVAMPLPQFILQNAAVDIVVTGEGEVTIVEILRKFQQAGVDADLSDITGMCRKNYTDQSIICQVPRPFIHNLDIVSALPAYDLLPMDVYLANPVIGIGRDIDMVTSRGCPFRCSFCYQPFGHRPRYYSVDFIVRTISHLKDHYKIDFVSFQDDEFMSNIERVQDFCQARNKYFPDILWTCTGRANIIARHSDLIKFMKASGCTLVSCGFESGSQRMLDSMHKQQNVAEMEGAVRVLRKNALPVAVSFIVGMPGETAESCRETVDFCLRNRIPLDSLMFATPYPGTALFDFAVATKRIDTKALHDFMMSLGDAREFLINLTDAFSDDELIAQRQEMMAITREHYRKYVSLDEIMNKTQELYGSLVTKYELDEQDLIHRAQHGGISIF